MPIGFAGGQTQNATQQQTQPLEQDAAQALGMDQNATQTSPAQLETPVQAQAQAAAVPQTQATAQAAPPAQVPQTQEQDQGGQQGDRESSIRHLQRNAHARSRGECARAVRQAVEASDIRLNCRLNPSWRPGYNGSAYGYGPVLEDAGFRAMPAGTEPQAGDVVVFPQSPGHEHGHMAMFDGQRWISDFWQRNIYGSLRREREQVSYTIYRFFP